ncbi:MAG: hypothetical protein ILP14_09720, partial [Oscillospiraceae bacterium]|nr:hypothetical protein [Oscillospiraceae bacterium]
PIRSHDAGIISQTDFSRILPGADTGSSQCRSGAGPVNAFTRLRGTSPSLPGGMTIDNPGTVPAWPKFTLYGSGTITLITYSGAVVLSGIGNGIVLDLEAQECTSLDGGQLLNDKVDGDPQYLPPGDSVISWTGTVARLMVTPNWRYL